MPRILTVDDSSTIRSIISKQLAELGFEVDQAEDGEQGLAHLRQVTVDLILLDVTMPVMDGPTMLQHLRESGNRTPVIMLTSESKRSIVAGAMKLGIEDYILKPFKPEELRAKVGKVLRLPEVAPIAAAPTPSVAPAAAPAPMAAAEVAPAAAAPTRGDMLMIDDMENVPKKFRTLLPPPLTLDSCVTARDAVKLCQERSFRVVVIDLVMPDVNSVALMNQLRALQPDAAFVALALRSNSDARTEARAMGFQDVLVKPFDADSIGEFLARYFDHDDLLGVDANVLKIANFDGKPAKLDRSYARLRDLLKEGLEKVASACYDDVIVDVSQMPVRPDKTVRLIIEAEKEARRFGLAMRIVGGSEAAAALQAIADTASLPFYPSVSAAQSASV
jgi:DNA-binding response OmpR family regulator